jgi:hypothetical protein
MGISKQIQLEEISADSFKGNALTVFAMSTNGNCKSVRRCCD